MILALLIALQTLPGVVAGEEADAPLFRADPRPTDAVAAWAARVEYQLGINAILNWNDLPPPPSGF